MSEDALPIQGAPPEKWPQLDLSSGNKSRGERSLAKFMDPLSHPPVHQPTASEKLVTTAPVKDRYSTEKFETVKAKDGKTNVVPVTAIVARTVRPESTIRGHIKSMGFVKYQLANGRGIGVLQVDALSIVERLKVSPEKGKRGGHGFTPAPLNTATSTQRARIFKRAGVRQERAPQPPGLKVTPKPSDPTKAPGFNPPPISANPIAQAMNNLRAVLSVEGFDLNSVSISPKDVKGK